MPQSFHTIPIHLVWSTKHRLPHIEPEIEIELYKYMASIFREYDSPALIINGSADHVHILSMLSRTVTLAKLIEEVKKSSSKWIKTKGDQYKNFYWQTGYAALGVGQYHIDNAKRYISNQKEHHRRWTFKKEYIDLLNKYSIKYDKRYIWD